MLSAVKIRNFECWEEFELKFDTNLMVITGVSDVGKSSLMRAIAWVVFNSIPSKKLYPRTINDRRIMSVELILDSGDIIERRWSPVENVYVFNGAELKGFGRGNVPVQIREALGLVGDNFRFQKDKHFLLGYLPSEITKVINSLMDLSEIESVIKNGEAEKRKTSGRISVLQKEHKEVSDKIKDSKWICDAEHDFDCWSNLNSELEHVKSEIEGLETCINNLENAFTALRKAEVIKTTAKDYSKVYQQLKTIIELEQLESDLRSLLAVIEKNVPEININLLSDNLDLIINSLNKLNQLESNIVSVGKVISSILMYRDKLNENPLNSIVNDFNELSGGVPVFDDSVDILSGLNDEISNLTVKKSKLLKELESLKHEESEIKINFRTCDKCGAFEYDWQI